MTKYRIMKLRKELGCIPNCKHSWCTTCPVKDMIAASRQLPQSKVVSP